MPKQTYSRPAFHATRLGLFAALALAFLIVRFDAGAEARANPKKSETAVLAYATEISRSSLLAATNVARAANGLGPLSLNSQLNSSAQMKADDMASKNYWAHVSPDGTQPWYFFQAAGYSYIRAGENLAYGFSSSQSTVDGWMNSPSHRENMLGEYNDVGFGFVNAPNYQNSGNQTIVVAHYGAQATPAAAPVTPSSTPAASQPAPTTSISPQPTPSAPTSSTTPVSTAPQSSLEKSDQPTLAQSQPSAANTDMSTSTVKTAQTSRVSVLNLITSHSLPLAALISLSIISFSISGFALTHRKAFQHAVANGEHFVAAHPGVDTMVVAAVTSLVLLTTYGHIG